MRVETTSKGFVNKLAEIANAPDLSQSVQRHSNELMQELLKLLDAEDKSTERLLKHIEYGRVSYPKAEVIIPPYEVFGLKVKGTNILLSEAMHAFENMVERDLPNQIKEYAPELSHDEWKAAIRMVIDVMTALDRRVDYQEGA